MWSEFYGVNCPSMTLKGIERRLRNIVVFADDYVQFDLYNGLDWIGLRKYTPEVHI